MRNCLRYLALSMLAGCGAGKSDGPPEVFPVAGQVLVDGKPAAGIEVTLLPGDAPMVPRIPRNPHAVTGADGRFAIGTFRDGDGAAEGGYQVLLKWPPEKKDAESEALDEDRLLGWYDGTHSTIGYRVNSGANEIPPIKVPKRTLPPEISPGIPGRN